MAACDFKKFVEDKRAQYKKIGKVFCPLLNEEVVFNAKGFYHLRYDGTGKMRSRQEQQYRMHQLDFVPDVIKKSKEVVDYQERGLKSGKVCYWEISYNIGNKTITVILRKIGNGGITFYSTWRE